MTRLAMKTRARAARRLSSLAILAWALLLLEPGALMAAEAKACTDLKTRVCEKAGERSEACVGFGIVGPLLSATACKAILSDFAPMMKRVAATRGDCELLVGKLCKDIGQETETCAMVKERVGEFPSEQCTMMLSEYAQVLAELKQVEEQNKPLSAALQAKQVAG